MSCLSPSLILFFLLLRSGYRTAHGVCSHCTDLTSVPAGFKELSYSETDEQLENPNRGFVMQDSGRASSYEQLYVEDLDKFRNDSGLTLHWRQYILDSFVDSDITADYLNKIREDMKIVREAKFTVVLRFMYTNEWNEGDKAPYGDATKQWMLKHIEQLKSVFVDFEDVIDVVNAGFIGVWGEWYYTTYFGDPTATDSDELTAQNWADRKEILDALLAAVPTSISVQLRYPLQKMHFYDSVATTEAEMKQKTKKARSGHHNDCFLASSLDRGTYVDRVVEYPYLEADSKHTVVGGETCTLSEDDPLDRYKCPTATKELKELHFSYLNQDYHKDVIKSWKMDGCFNAIHQNLGYRLVLKKAILPTSLQQGGKFCFHLELENTGYAAPFKQKTLSVMLRDKTSGGLYSANLDYDLKTWLPGNPIIVDTTAYVPTDLPTGTYEVLLAIKDKLSSAHSDYNILLANNDEVPERRKGLNNLKHDVTVGAAGTAGDSSCPTLTAVDAQPESKYDRTYESSAVSMTTMLEETTPLDSTSQPATTPLGSASTTLLINYSVFVFVVVLSLVAAH